MFLEKQLHIWISNEQYKKLCQASDKCNINISALIRGAIAKEVKYILEHEY